MTTSPIGVLRIAFLLGMSVLSLDHQTRTGHETYGLAKREREVGRRAVDLRGDLPAVDRCLDPARLAGWKDEAPKPNLSPAAGEVECRAGVRFTLAVRAPCSAGNEGHHYGTLGIDRRKSQRAVERVEPAAADRVED
jgi:hypothetical protein